MVMKYLTPFRAQCNNCFPEYYYFSPKTGVCYNEFINSTSFTKHVLQQNTSTPAGIEALKKDFLQVGVCVVDCVRVLVCVKGRCVSERAVCKREICPCADSFAVMSA